MDKPVAISAAFKLALEAYTLQADTTSVRQKVSAAISAEHRSQYREI